MEEKVIYRLNDDISFRKCTLFEGKKTVHGNCTNFDEKDEHWKTYFFCNQYGIHLHCTKHPEIEYGVKNNGVYVELSCPKCKTEIQISSFKQTLNQCLKLL